jgi:glycosyltransferase involved in cell wall biosynthesis
MSNIRFSILICSLEERAEQLAALLQDLERQKTDQVEILTNIDNRQHTIGAKRNDLALRAQGDYLAYIDDDDKVSERYVDLNLQAMESNPDCIGMEGVISFASSGIVRKFIHSIQYSSWYQKGEVYYRCPNHLSPVKRELALKVLFSNISVGEDRIYSEKLRPLLTTEVYIPEPIYYYYTN